MAYAVENARFQWEEGERRVRDASDPAEAERAVRAVLDELRRRLGSTFTIDELASFYAEGVDWASTLAFAAGAAEQPSWIVDAAFCRYAREAADWAGGRRRA